MDFHKVLPIFFKCLVLYTHIPVGEDYIVCISRLSTIDDRQSGFNFLIPVPNNFSAAQYNPTFDTYVVPTMRYTYCIVFDRHTFFMSAHLYSYAANKAIKVEPYILYHT